jgi:UDP-N-acetylglucosamine--N-acetylmuramyl-(pentapeptide) pyrophosphoryl-undecaprenol N-acetylglucosamine transferase
MRIWFAGGGTGGHLYPGLAIARALVRRDRRVKPYFVGALRGIEKDVLPTTEFPYRLLDLHPLYRQRPWENWRTLRGAFGAWRSLGELAREERPSALVATGGYAAGLALAWARAHKVPYVVQEQNSHPGLTTRFFSRWARECYLGFPESGPLLKPGGYTSLVDTGNPIDPPPSPRPERAAARRHWDLPARGRVLLVFGGSQGSAAMNKVVDAWISRALPPGLHVIWATGRKNFEQHAHRESERVRVRPYLAPIADAYAAADLALVRAGAMGTAELCAWGVPMLLCPLPTAAADHQTANARALAEAGAGTLILQSELTPERLDGEVRALLADDSRLARMAAAAEQRGRPDAAATIAARILTLVAASQHG